MHPSLLPLYLLLRLTPDAVNARISARAINHLLRGQALVPRLHELDGKSFSIHISDVPCQLRFHLRNGRVQALRTGTGDVTITGELSGFMQLANRSQDPDTLFFQRRLTIEGETETGVHIKNLLDSLEYDWDAHFDAVLFPPIAGRAKRFLRITRHYAPAVTGLVARCSGRVKDKTETTQQHASNENQAPSHEHRKPST